MVGTIQTFQVYCGSTAKGRRTRQMEVDSLEECADACATANPRCTAATFNGKSCALHNETDFPLTAPDPSPSFTAVVGLPTASTSNCQAVRKATDQQTVSSVEFSLTCGSSVNGNNLANHFAPTLQDCMTQCSKTSLCKAVSFNADQSLGFQNCYLKSDAPSDQVLLDTAVDTAVVVGGASNSQNSTTGSASTTSKQTMSDSTVSMTNVVIIVAAVMSGIVFLAMITAFAFWMHKRKEKQRQSQLSVGVQPIWHRDRMDEKYGIRTSVAWSELVLEGNDKPTPVYEIRRKGESYYGPN